MSGIRRIPHLQHQLPPVSIATQHFSPLGRLVAMVTGGCWRFTFSLRSNLQLHAMSLDLINATPTTWKWELARAGALSLAWALLPGNTVPWALTVLSRERCFLFPSALTLAWGRRWTLNASISLQRLRAARTHPRDATRLDPYRRGCTPKEIMRLLGSG